MNTFFRQLSVLGCCVGLLLCLSSCGKDNRCKVSIGATNFRIEPNVAGDWQGLNSVGGYVYATGGHRGVVIIRTGLTEFVAFERTCPEDNSSRVEVSEDWGISILECPTCHSQFLVNNNGMPTEGSATPCALYEYSTTYSGGELYVY